MRILGFLFKLLLVVVVILLILQAEYKGRKLKTYVLEYAKSLVASGDTSVEDDSMDEQSEPEKKIETKKIEKAQKKVQTTAPAVKEHKKGKKAKSDKVDIPDEDREQLQNLLDN